MGRLMWSNDRFQKSETSVKQIFSPLPGRPLCATCVPWRLRSGAGPTATQCLRPVQSSACRLACSNPNARMAADPGHAFVRLRGLPFQATDEDIRLFFKDYEVASIFIPRRAGTVTLQFWRLEDVRARLRQITCAERPTGEAYVEFGSKEAALKAQTEKQNAIMAHRYIECALAAQTCYSL